MDDLWVEIEVHRSFLFKRSIVGYLEPTSLARSQNGLRAPTSRRRQQKKKTAADSTSDRIGVLSKTATRQSRSFAHCRRPWLAGENGAWDRVGVVFVQIIITIIMIIFNE